MADTQSSNNERALKDRWLKIVLNVDLSKQRPAQPAAAAKPAAAPAPDYTVGVNPPPADFATFPDDLKQMWEQVKAGDKKAYEDWKTIMGTPESARQNKAGRAQAAAELQQAKEGAARDKGILGVVSAVSPLAGAVLSEIGGSETLKELAKTDWGKEWNDTALAIGGQVQKRVDSLAEGIVAVPDALKGAASKVGKGVDALAEGIVALPDQAKAAAATVKAAVTGWDAEQLKSVLGTAADKLAETGSHAIDAIGETATDLGKAAGAALDKASDRLADIITDPGAAAKAAADTVSGAYKSTRDAVRRADKAFWRSDPEAMRERLADYTVEAASQAAQAVAFEGVAKGLGKGIELVRGGKAAAEGAEAVAAGAKAARGARVAESEAVETAARGARRVEGASAEAGFGMSPETPTVRITPGEPAPAFGANPEPARIELAAGEEPAGAAARGEPRPEGRYRPSSEEGGSFDVSEDAELDAPDADTTKTVAPKAGEYNKLHEAQAKILGAQREVEGLAGVEERVAGGRADTVERAYKQYQDGLEKARQSLGDAHFRGQLSPDELKELEEAVHPDKVKSLDDFRKSAGLEPLGNPETAATVKMGPPGEDATAATVKMGPPGEDATAATQRFEPGKQPGIDPNKTQRLEPVDFGPENAAKAVDPAVAKKVQAAADKIKTAKPAALKKLPNAEKQKLIKDLVAGGKPSGETREALKKIYGSMDLDPKFVEKESKRIAKIGDAFKGDKQLRQARNDWHTLKPEDKVKNLKRVVAEQSKQYGIATPEIALIDKAPEKNGAILNGYFNGKDGKIYLNANSAGALNDFDGALDLVAHENAHNYQKQLVAKLESGLLKAGDAEYEQAVMFAANAEPGAQIRPEMASEMADYMKQPKEAHSFHVGPTTAQQILKVL